MSSPGETSRGGSPGLSRSNWDTIKTRTKYYVPGTSWIPNYSAGTYAPISLWSFISDAVLRRLLGDVIAGATLASILIPQSISYSTSLARLGPLTGLVRGFGRPCIHLLVLTFSILHRPE